MKKTKLLALLTALAMVLSLVYLPVYSENETPDYQLTTDEWTAGNDFIDIYFTNNTQQEAELTGPVDIKVTQQGMGWFLHWDRQPLDPDMGDEVFSGQESLTVAPGDTVLVASLAPGDGSDWRSYHSAYFDLQADLWIVIDGVDYRLEAPWHEVIPMAIPYDISFSVNGPVEYTHGVDLSAVLIVSATNNSPADITINGPVVINPDMMPVTHREIYDLTGGQSMTIPPGETVEVLEIHPGPPMSWRNFYFPQIKYFQAYFALDGVSGEYIYEYSQGKFCILGHIEDDEMDVSLIDLSDNEDGTATITINIDHTMTSWGVETVNGECEFFWEEPILVGPMEGLKRDHFILYRFLEGGVQEPIGKTISSLETSPGIYEIIWSHEDGTHTIFLEIFDEETNMWGILNNDPDGWDPDIIVIVSTQNRPVVSAVDETTGKYTGTLEYKTTKMTFTADEPVDVEINFKRKGETLAPPPADMEAAGIFMEISLASGTLPESAEILLEIDYSRDDIPAGMNENNLRLYRYNEDTEIWEILPDQTIDTENKIISVILRGFSEFGVFEAPDEDLDTDDETPDETPDDDYQEDMGDNAVIAIFAAAVILSLVAIVIVMKKTKKN